VHSSATVVRCWFTGEARDIEKNLRPCIPRRSSNYMESASTESQNSYLHWTVFHALKTHLFTLDCSHGSRQCFWLAISIDELWRRIQIESLIDCSCSSPYAVTLRCYAGTKLCGIAWSSWAHKTESLSAMDQPQSGMASSTGSDQNW